MRLLLDTHALLWFLADDPRLSSSAKSVIEDPANDPFDRLIAATALVEKLTLVSADAKFDAYGVQRHW